MAVEKTKSLSSNMEDYLEVIANLKKDIGVARVRDIGKALNVKSPSVNSAMKALSDLGLVIHERYEHVDLTDKGAKLAKDIKKKHDIMVRFFTTILNVSPKTAVEDACKMEHAMSMETFEKFSLFMNFLDTCPEKERPRCLKSYKYYLNTGKRREYTKRSK